MPRMAAESVLQAHTLLFRAHVRITLTALEAVDLTYHCPSGSSHSRITLVIYLAKQWDVT
eukprot:1159865-Pelagomonas_calceolata.AAC.3